MPKFIFQMRKELQIFWCISIKLISDKKKKQINIYIF